MTIHSCPSWDSDSAHLTCSYIRCHSWSVLSFVLMSLFHPIWYFLWHRYVSLWFGISGAFQTIDPLCCAICSSHFFCFTSASSNLFCPYLSFSHTLYGSTLLLHHCSSISLCYSFFPSPLISSPVSSPVLFSGEEGFSQCEPRALNPSCLLSDFLFPTSLFRSSYASLSLSLSLFDRDLNSPELDSVTHM